MTIRIAHVSDLHASPEKPFFNANMHRLMEELRDRRPDMVLNTGDLGLFGEQDNGDLALAMEAHRSVGIETHIVPGNHDIGEHPDIANRVHLDEASLARYRARVGADFWTLDLPGWRLIGLNALVIGTGLSGDEAQTEMLTKAVRERGGRAVAIVMHKPLCDLDLDDALVSNRFMTLPARRKLLAAFAGHAPALILCGHVHQYRDAVIAGSMHLWGPAASFVIGDPWQPSYGAKPIGYLEHLFHADGTHQHRLMTVRGLAHNDLAAFPEAYGDITARGPGNA
ncbi:MAG: metallophosphoesterase family protein [Beijerinckiaceae bacterium]